MQKASVAQQNPQAFWTLAAGVVDKILTRAASRVADDVPDGSDPRIAVIMHILSNHAVLIPADPDEEEEYLRRSCYGQLGCDDDFDIDS